MIEITRQQRFYRYQVSILVSELAEIEQKLLGGELKAEMGRLMRRAREHSFPTVNTWISQAQYDRLQAMGYIAR